MILDMEERTGVQVSEMTQVRCKADSIRVAAACPDELTLILRTKGESNVYLPVRVDRHEGQILADKLNGRPDSKRALDSFLADKGVTDSGLGSTTIYLKDNTFFAKAPLTPHTRPHEFGCSIGVAVALAMRANAPILVDDTLFDRPGVGLE